MYNDRNSVPEDMCAAKLGISTFLIDEFAENPENADLSQFSFGTFEDAERFINDKLKATV